MGEGISGWVAEEKKPLLIKDLTKHGIFKKRNGKYHNDSLLSVPLIVGDEVIGVLNVNNKKTKGVFTEDDLRTLMAIANEAAVLIRNSQQYARIKKLNEVKSEFVSMVSHELRTPLSVIKESLELLLDKVPGEINKKQENILSMAKRSIDRLNRLIAETLDISKMEAGKASMKREYVDIVSMIKEVTTSFKQNAKKKPIAIKAHVLDKVKGVWADSDRLNQVLNNLIGNAIKYTPKGGKVDVTLKKTDSGIEIVVADTGVGIKEKDIKRVFEKYSNLSFTDGRIISTGLGLAITKDIVELHKGVIRVESVPNQGSRFIVELPVDLREGDERKA